MIAGSWRLVARPRLPWTLPAHLSLTYLIPILTESFHISNHLIFSYLRLYLTAAPESGENKEVPSAGVTQLVECNLAKVDVAGSNPVSRSILNLP